MFKPAETFQLQHNVVAHPPPSVAATCFASCTKNGCPFAMVFAIPSSALYNSKTSKPVFKLTLGSPRAAAPPTATSSIRNLITRPCALSPKKSLHLRRIESIKWLMCFLLHHRCRVSFAWAIRAAGRAAAVLRPRIVRGFGWLSRLVLLTGRCCVGAVLRCAGGGLGVARAVCCGLPGSGMCVSMAFS